MFLNLHLNIKSYKLAKVPVCVGVFSSKYRTNFKYSPKPTAYCHLFTKLR